jgi:hypothetical protein
VSIRVRIDHLAIVLLSATLAITHAARVAAHDVERTQVLLTFARDGSFVLDVANDPNWLKLRMEPFQGNFIDRVVLWVDGGEVRPSSAELIPGDGLATYRLRGQMPIDARSLRWYYGLVGDPYPLTIRRADGRVQVEEIAGNAWSRTIDLTGQFQQPRMLDRIAPIAVFGLMLVPFAIRIYGHLAKRNHEDTKTRKKEGLLRVFVASWRAFR